MRTAALSSPSRRRLWLAGALAPLVVAACATSGPAPDDDGSIDVGYGEVDEEHVDGSVETVEVGERLNDRIETLADMLRRLPGVRVSVEGENLVVRIRGSSSFLASEEPLVVMDGMEYRGALRAINPYSIDSITVLKNAGDTAVYGSRGANGVILITTKTGKKSSGA